MGTPKNCPFFQKRKNGQAQKKMGARWAINKKIKKSLITKKKWHIEKKIQTRFTMVQSKKNVV